MSIRSGQMMKKSNDWIFWNKQKTFLSLVFNQPRCHGNSKHRSQNARINSFVAPKLKWLRSNGELGIGS